MNDSILPLICECQTEAPTHLHQTEQGAACTTCGRIYPTTNGYYDLIPDEDFYWNEFPQEQMQKFLELGHAAGWEAMIQAATADMPPNFGWLLRSNARVDSVFHGYAPEQAHSCLDIGCGWGTTTESLARLYDEVWALDPVHERLEATQIRLQHQGITNVNLVRTFLHRLPFEENTFDLVTVIGVLEWIPLATTEHPTETQTKFLAEVQRILKPGGFLLLGIENRFGAQLLMGVQDHSGLHFTSFLPRKVADWVIRLNHARKADTHVLSHDSAQAYRTYTYTHNGYQQLLQNAGFTNSELYWTTSYQFPRYSGPIEAGTVRFFLQTATGKFRRFQSAFKLVQRLVGWIPDAILTKLLRTFTPNFLILGLKEEQPETLQARILAAMPSHNTWLKVGGADGPEGRMQYFALDKKDGQPVEIAAFARFNRASEAVGIEYDCMQRFTNLTVEARQINKHQIWQHPYIPSRESRHVAEIRRGLAWLDQWQQENGPEPDQPATGSKQEFEHYIQNTLAEAEKLSIHKSLWQTATEKVMDYVGELDIIAIRKTPEHRDFSYSNVRIVNQPAPSSENADDSFNDLLVIDWDLFQSIGWPFFDALNLIITFFAPAFHQARFQQVLDDPEFQELLDFWADKLQQEPEFMWHLIPYYLARNLIDSHQDGLLHRAAAENLLEVWCQHSE